MEQRSYFGFTVQEATDIWCRWKEGESLSDIGRAIGKPPGCIHRLVASNGGIVPVARRRAKRALKLYEREEISRGLAANMTIRQIAGKLNRAPSTICREINRNGGSNSYIAHKAENNARDKSRRPKDCYLLKNQMLREIVTVKISLKWSPEQLAGWLKIMYPYIEFIS